MRHSLTRVLVSVSILVGAASAPSGSARAQVSSLERSARQMIQRFEYEEATELLREALVTDLPPEEELVAWRLLAEVRAKANDERGALGAARELYARDPGEPLPSPRSLPPRIRAFYVDARDRARDEGAAEVEVTATLAEGRTVVRGQLGGSGLAVRLRLGIDDGSGMVEHSPRLDGRSFEQRWPATGELRYYVIAEAPSGFVVARAGSEAEPRVLRVEGADVGTLVVGGRDDDEGPDLVPFLIAGGAAIAVAVVLGIVFAARPWVEQPTIDGAVVVP